MKIDFDINKSNKNKKERDLSFDRVIDFDWEGAIYSEDSRHDYPEQRFVAMGYLDDRLHVLCFIPIKDGLRVISFRKANSREVKRYEENTDY